MADLIKYPFKRVTYPGIDNPLYVDDIQTANEGVMAAIAGMANLGPDDFAIISGLNYEPDTIPFYTPGIVYILGTFYRVEQSFPQGNWLVPTATTYLAEPFNDGTTRPVYNYFSASASPNNPDPINNSGGPQFVGDMNVWRVGNDWLAASVRSLLNTQLHLGTAAFANIGQGNGNVAAGNDPRLVYTSAQLDARFAQIINVITKFSPAGPSAYIPINPGDPVNKQYSDATSGRRLASGTIDLGDGDTGGGTTHTIALGLTLPDNAYIIDWSLEDVGVNPAIATFYCPTIRNKTTTSFDFWLREAQAGVQHVFLSWIAWSK